MAEDAIGARLTLVAEQVLASYQFELVDVELRREGRRLVACLYIDKPAGITLDDCALVSREVSTILDAEDLIAERYTLEVSSPGLNRPLKVPRDYARAVGKLVRVKTLQLHPDEAGNKRKTFLGRLQALQDDAVLVIDLQEGQQAFIPLHLVAKANLEFEF